MTALHVAPLTTSSWLLSIFIYFSPFLIVLIGIVARWRYRTNLILFVCVLAWSVAIFLLQKFDSESGAVSVGMYFLIKPVVYLVGCAVAVVIGFLIAKITQAKA